MLPHRRICLLNSWGGIHKPRKENPKPTLGFSNYPQWLVSQIADGIKVSRASKSLEILGSILSDAWRTLCSAGTGDFVPLLGASAAQSFQADESQGFKWALLSESPETASEIEIRECSLCSAEGRAGLGSWWCLMFRQLSAGLVLC